MDRSRRVTIFGSCLAICLLPHFKRSSAACTVCRTSGGRYGMNLWQHPWKISLEDLARYGRRRLPSHDGDSGKSWMRAATPCQHVYGPRRPLIYRVGSRFSAEGPKSRAMHTMCITDCLTHVSTTARKKKATPQKDPRYIQEFRRDSLSYGQNSLHRAHRAYSTLMRIPYNPYKGSPL